MVDLVAAPSALWLTMGHGIKWRQKSILKEEQKPPGIHTHLDMGELRY